jgi:hypothetical protein
MIVESASAQSIAKPSLPEFSLRVQDDSYIIPWKNVTTTDPYTGKVTWILEGGGHFEDQKIIVTIKNPLFTSVKTADNNMTHLCYSVRAKGHYEEWKPSAEPHLIYAENASNSEKTVITYYLQGEPNWGSFYNGGEVDVQVKSMVGYHYTTKNSDVWLYPTYTTHFQELASSDWSETKTVTIPKELRNPLPPWWTGPTPEPITDTTTKPTPAATEIQSGSNFAQPHLDLVWLVMFIVVTVVFVSLVVIIVLLRRRIKVLAQKQNAG